MDELLKLDKVSKKYPKFYLNNVSFSIKKGQIVGFIGRNGAGKSTLLRIIAGVDKDFTGNVKYGAGVSVGYFSQDSAEKISGSQSILEYMEERSPLDLIPKMRDMLGSFLFRGDDVFKSINVLSGGEKSRIALLELLLRPVNLLILDEPTNHLDMHSKDVLLDALKDFGGTVMFVSHDRGFIEDLSTKVLELHPGVSREFPGDYKYYMQRLEDEANGLVGNADSAENTVAVKKEENAAEQKTATKLNWEEQKKQEAERRKIQKEVERLEQEIEKTEAKKTELENQMALPEVYSNGEKAKEVQKQIEELAAKLDKLNEDWMTAAEKLE